jgi:ribose transport system substrate-binding protein
MKNKILIGLSVMVGVFFIISCTKKNAPDTAGTVPEATDIVKVAGWTNAYDGKTGLEPAPQRKDGKIVMAHIPSAMNTHHQIVIYGVEDQIKKLNLRDRIELLVQAPSGQSAVEEQVAIVESFIERGVDVISCAPSAGSDEALLAVYQKAAQAGIPVFEFNTPALGSVSPHLVSNVGYEQPGASAMIAEWIVTKAGGKDINVGVIQGMPGIHSNERWRGFKSVVDKNSNLKIIDNQYAENWSVEKAMGIAETMLNAHPEIQVIWCQYDELALGVYTVVKSLGMQDKVMILGYENIPEANTSIRLGEMWATVDNGPKQMGRNIVTAVNDYVFNGKMVEKIFNLESKVYDRDNIAVFDVSEYSK